MRITSLRVHPVKSTAVRPVASAQLQLRGLAGDRDWVVVDADGTVVTARELHALLGVVADTPGTDPELASDLRLRHPALPDLHLAHPTGPRVRVGLFAHELTGVAAGPEAHAWLRAALGRDDLRLVWCDDPTRRRLNPLHSEPGDHTAYADGYPLTVASEASLARLDQWVREEARARGEEPPAPLPMDRFRPNLVVDGDEPFTEDHWLRVRVGDVVLRRAKPTDRCVITTIDPATLRTGKEPLRTLARHRRHEGKTLFAVHLIPETTGTVSVGDEVEVTVRRDAPGR